VEKRVQVFKQELQAVTAGLAELKTETHQTNIVVGSLRDQINKLFWTGAGVFVTCSVIWTIGAVFWKALKNGGLG